MKDNILTSYSEDGSQDETKDRLYRIRHSLAHVLAQAVLEIRPNARLAFGPPINTGCYYDFDLDVPISSEDFSEIEKRMRRIIGEKQTFLSSERSIDDAIEYLDSKGAIFKAEYARELKERGENSIGFYLNGPFEDMCAGPHVVDTGEIPTQAFCLDSVAGAYWRGDEKNPQLTRIYCLAFESKALLEDYLTRRKLAEERDHRKLGRELELFMFADEVGPGLPLWLPYGTVLRDELEKFAREVEHKAGYQRVSTPVMAKESLYLTSGHLPYYADSLYPPMQLEGECKYYLRGMNCPHHHLIFKHRPRSYRELPLRLAEYGNVYRYEASGTLAGLLRVRGMCMNDAHIYCTPTQLHDELKATFEMALSYYKQLKFGRIRVRLSTHDPKNTDKFIHNPELWEYSERIALEVIKDVGLDYFIGEGEAAFYGPKIDFQATTLLGREETLSTTQLDFGQAINFDLKYVGDDGKDHPVYVVHRAPLSTHERFIAFLIEHFGGAFPTWLAPLQVRIVPVAAECVEYAQSIEAELRESLFRITTDLSTNSFNKKIREAVTQKVPNILIIGKNERDNNTITLRRYGVKEQSVMTRAEFIEYMIKIRAERIMDCAGITCNEG
jgi:threonyl-tRNA synthetase